MRFTTVSQKFATSLSPKYSAKYTRFKISFLKQLPPNPGPESKNLEPIRLSVPIALDTSLTSAPVASHNAAIELIELILCAKKALAVSFASSLLQIFVKSIFSFGTQFV